MLRAALATACLVASSGVLGAAVATPSAHDLAVHVDVSAVPEARADVVAAVASVAPPSAHGLLTDRYVNAFRVDGAVHAIVLDLVTVPSAGTSARMTEITVARSPMVLRTVYATSATEPDAEDAPGPDPDPKIRGEGEGQVVCTKGYWTTVRDEDCEDKKAAAAASAAMICANAAGAASFGGPVGAAAAAIGCSAAWLAVAAITCDPPVDVWVPPVCHRVWPEPAEPAVKEAERQSGQRRPNPCERSAAPKGPVCE